MPIYRQVRFQCCRSRLMRNCSVWGPIVFSEAYRFQLCPDDNHRRLRRRPRQWWDPVVTITHHMGPQQSIIYWGAISFDSRTSLVINFETLTAQWYIEDSLLPVMSPFLLWHPGHTFLHDNFLSVTQHVLLWIIFKFVLSYTSFASLTFPLIPRSPDLPLSLIEHISDIMREWLQPSRNKS